MNYDLNEFKYKYETHLHTSEASKCGHDRGYDMAKACKEAGYDGIFVTDHAWGGNTAIDRSLPWKEWVTEFAKGYESAKAWGDENGLNVWYGYESGYDATEFLIYGITPDWMKKHPELHDATMEEQLDIIHSGGGYVVQAHPYRDEYYIPEVRPLPQYADGIEGFNAAHICPAEKNPKHPDWNENAVKLAIDNNKPMTAGSDIHSVNLFGGGILTKSPLSDPQDFISLLKSDEMYLLCDGVNLYDRYGNIIK